MNEWAYKEFPLLFHLLCKNQSTLIAPAGEPEDLVRQNTYMPGLPALGIL